MDPAVIIPAYCPGPELVNTVKKLTEKINPRIIVVNNGNGPESDPIFKEIDKLSNVEIVTHVVNMGKGQALKTGFNHYLLHHSKEHCGVVTCDADGQHLVKDIDHVQQALMSNPNKLYLGTRIFNRNIPFKSLFGNTLSRYVFRFFSGKMLGDTMTGLRGIPNSLLPFCLSITSTGYEYELEMLMGVIRSGLEVEEISIETVYLDKDNSSSHFKPVIDSLMIYLVFFRLSIVSILSVIIDCIVFSLVFLSFKSVMASFIIGRICSSIFNYNCIKKDIRFVQIVKCLALTLILLSFSYGLVMGMASIFGIHIIVAKIIAEFILFLASFGMQRRICAR